MTTAPAAPPGRSRQPWLHELEVAVHGNVTCLSHRSGDLEAAAEGQSAAGLYVDDRRVLDHLVLTVDGVRPVPSSPRPRARAPPACCSPATSATRARTPPSRCGAAGSCATVG